MRGTGLDDLLCYALMALQSDLIRMKAHLGRIGQRANGPTSFSLSLGFWSATCEQCCPSYRHGLLRYKPGLFQESGGPQHTPRPNHSGLEYIMQGLRPWGPPSAFLALSGHGILLMDTVDKGLLRAPAKATDIHKGCWKSRGAQETLFGNLQLTPICRYIWNTFGDVLVEEDRCRKEQKLELRDICADMTVLSSTGWDVCTHWVTLGTPRPYGEERITVKETGCHAKHLQC